MKKNRLLCATLLLLVMHAKAQVLIGPKLGIHIGTVNYSTNSPNIFNLTKFSIGGYASIAISKNFLFTPEFLYTGKGHTYSTGFTKITSELNYLELPLLLKARFGAKTLRPFLLFGPTPALLVSRSYSSDFGFQVIESVAPKSIDLGIMLGAGIDIVTEKATVTLEVRYNPALTAFVTTTNGTSIYHRGLYIMMGFGLPLRKKI